MLMFYRHGSSLINYRRCGSSLSNMQHRIRLISPNCNSSSASGVPVRRNFTPRTNRGFFWWYNKQLDERPITTKIISSALIAASGDIICQVLENNFSVDRENVRNCVNVPANIAPITSESSDASLLNAGGEDERARQQQNTKSTIGTESKSASLDVAIDWDRTQRFLLIGAFWVAPATHLWYGFLSTRLIPGAATPKRVLQRLFLDQFGAAPVFCPAFMGLLWLLEGKSPSDVKSGLIEAGPTLVTSNWKLWIPAMGLMFSVVPLKFQVVYSNFVGLVWTVYLSYASTRL